MEKLLKNAPIIWLGVFTFAVYLLLDWLIPSLVWAGVIATAIWPLYRIKRSKIARHWKRAWVAPLLASLTVSVISFVPLSFLIASLISQVSDAAVKLTIISQSTLPHSLANLPFLGKYIQKIWANLSSGSLIPAESLMSWTTLIGGDLLSRINTFNLSFFFLYFALRYGDVLSKNLLTALTYVNFPEAGVALKKVSLLIRSVFSGFVLIGIIEALLFWGLFSYCGIDSSALLGVAIGILASIPLAAPILLTLISLYAWLFIGIGESLIIGTFGVVVLLILDPIVRPAISGHKLKIGTVAMLFFMFGGMKVFGLLGVFIGPIIYVLWIHCYQHLFNASQVSNPNTPT